MVQLEALKLSSQVTIAATAGALASVFFANWVNELGFLKSVPLIVGYTLFIFGILYLFYKKLPDTKLTSSSALFPSLQGISLFQHLSKNA